jgi:tetratricopeptide (TPR) repeat protein
LDPIDKEQMVLASHDDSGALDALQYSLASDIVELVVLTRDELFLQTLREAVGSARRLWHVLRPEKVSDLLVAGEVGIVVLDVATMHDNASVFVAQINRQFPDLVVVVAGNRAAEIELAPLISAGTVYRFIHKPMSPGRARLFAEAAVRKYGEQRLRATQPAERRAPQRNYLPAGIATVAALAVIVAVFWALGTGSHQGANRPVGGGKTVSGHTALLARAQAALASNRLTAPAGDNALELYLQASAQSPADPAARAGLADVRDRLLARAENALLEERLDEAAAAIETAHRSGVESGRIAFLTAQLAKLKDQVRAARTRAAAAKTTAPGIDDKAAERVSGLVALAKARLDAGQLIEPEHDDARYYVEAALSIDPADDAVQDVRQALAMRLLSAAHGAIERRDFEHAAEWLHAADGIASPSNLETLQTLLSGARQESQADAVASP